MPKIGRYDFPVTPCSQGHACVFGTDECYPHIFTFLLRFCKASVSITPRLLAFCFRATGGSPACPNGPAVTPRRRARPLLFGRGCCRPTRTELDGNSTPTKEIIPLRSGCVYCLSSDRRSLGHFAARLCCPSLGVRTGAGGVLTFRSKVRLY